MKHVNRFLQFKITFPEVLLVVIVTLGAALRFYNIPYRYGFDYDAARDSLIALYGAQTFTFPLHGPPSALGTFHFGPWYYFQLIFSQILFPFQYTAWYSVTIISIIGIVCMYVLGKKIGDWKLGVIFALLTSISPSLVTSGTGLSNPNMVITLTAASLLVFVAMIKEKKNTWYGVLLGFLIGIAINYHYQALTLLILFPALLIIQSHNRIKNIGAGIAGILVACVPLIIFNFANDWHTLRGLLFYITEGKNAVYIPNSWTIYLRDFWPQFWANTFGLPILLGIVLGIFSVGIIGVSAFKKKLNTSIVAFMCIFFIQFVYLRYFSSSREIYYVYFLQPFIIGLAGIAIWQLSKIKFGVYIAGILLLCMMVLILPKSIATSKSTQSFALYQSDVTQLIEQYPNQKFTLFDCGTIEKNHSHAFAFLLAHKGILSEDGIKVIFEDETCQVNRSILNGNTVKELQIKRDVDNHKKKIFVLQSDTYKKVLDAGWEEISPESVYKRELL